MISRETPLARLHEAAGVKLTHFAGWRLPVQFGLVAEEVTACRRAAALFDISHMGKLTLAGEGARAVSRELLTRHVTTVPVGCSVYGLVCNESGGIRDDVIAMVETDTRVRWIVNAANYDADYAWVRGQLRGRAELVDRLTPSFGLALQGPRAEEILRLAPLAGELPQYAFTHSTVRIGSAEVLVSRTGYTGEDGFEIFGQAEEGPGVWGLLLEVGKNLGVARAGLAARDVLRQEMGYPLWGQDIDARTTPLEAGLRWAIDWEGEFIGRASLEQSQPRRRRVGLVLTEPGVPRAGAAVFAGGDRIGELTSGTYSHNLRAGIGQGYIGRDAKAELGDAVEVEIRGRRLAARLSRLPLLPAKTKPSWLKVKGRTQA